MPDSLLEFMLAHPGYEFRFDQPMPRTLRVRIVVIRDHQVYSSQRCIDVAMIRDCNFDLLKRELELCLRIVTAERAHA
jgi:hypothetical protein